MSVMTRLEDLVEDIKDFVHYNWPIAIVMALVVLFLAFSLFMAVRGADEKANANAIHDRLMQQCLDDGFKEYQCVAMLDGEAKKRSSTTVVPVFIPIR